jgi:hypothetical protein
MMSMMLVGTHSTTKKSRRFLFVATTTSSIGRFTQHVCSQISHWTVCPNFFKRIFSTVAYLTHAHFSMTAWIGFARGIGMQVNPRIDAKGLAITQKKLLTFSEFSGFY